jgi:hypothetical protein
MAKILFDIAAHEPAGLQDGHLLMEIGPHIFSYAAMDKDKNLFHLRCYELDMHGNYDMAGEIAGIINNDDLLKAPAAEKTVVYNFPESQLIPEACFHSGNSKDMAGLLHGDLNQGIVLNEKIEGRQQYNVYQVPAEIHQLLQRSFTGSKYWHYYSLWISLRQRQADLPDNFISVLFYPNRILVQAVKNRQLHLLQSYGFEAAEDAGYYLLNICLQLELSPEATPILLSGMFDGSSALYTEIYKYFGQVSSESFPGASSIAALEEYPAHFFSPLLNLALCVS